MNNSFEMKYFQNKRRKYIIGHLRIAQRGAKQTPSANWQLTGELKPPDKD